MAVWKGCSGRFLVLRCRVPHAVTRESWGLPRDSQQGHRPQPLTLSEAQHPTAQVQTPQGRALWAIPAPFPSRLRFRAQCVKHRHQQTHVYNQQAEAEAPFGGGGVNRTGAVPKPFLLSLRRLHRTPKVPWSSVERVPPPLRVSGLEGRGRALLVSLNC